ncbi:MAG: peptidoglycan recognition family protein [Clostridium sp.]
MLPIKKAISKFNYSSGNKPKYIVIHYTGNVGDTAANNAKYFSIDRNSSAHYFVDDDSIVQVVEDYNGAWHCGDGKGKYGITNKNSIGIEMCGTDRGNISDATIKHTQNLVKYLMQKHNISIENVVRHYDASRKNCPSAFSKNDWVRWHEFKKGLVSIGDDDMIADSVKLFVSAKSEVMESEIKLLQKVVGMKETGIATEELVRKLPELTCSETRGVVTVMQRILQLRGYAKNIDTGTMGPACKGAIERFKIAMGIPLDTKLVDKQTWRKLLEY